ncbi:MAG: orotidine-5'-phosphate decarboxylase [Actinomycetota bacterium]|nr:orotidine-5'-phosphate decarboxylase [Actinomycetota bacterium]
MGEPFGARFRAVVEERGPLCVGIDPHPALLRSWELDDDLAGLERFARTAVDALAGTVAAIKPQSAFFERFGSGGIAVLESCLSAIRAGGTLAVLDVKRGDIGSTMQAYARAYLDPASPLAADAVTASPYLGFGSLQPLLDAAERWGAGVFVLALTSNPEGAAVQRAVPLAATTTVAGSILDAAAAANAGKSPLGSVGVVIGATVADVGHDLAPLNGPVLAPGLGAQGAGPDDLARLFAAVRRDVLPTYSRELLAAGPSAAGLQEAARRAADACSHALA